MGMLFKYFLRSLVDWVFRRRSPGLLTMRIGLCCLVLVFGAGWALDISFPFKDGHVDIKFNSSGGISDIFVYMAGFAGLCLIATGLVLEISRSLDNKKHLNRKKIVVVEVRGLRDTSGTPLLEAIPKNLEGARDSVLVDIRQGIKDGEIAEPEAALEKLVSLSGDLKRRESGLDRRDLTLVYGGLSPVPFTFLTGVLIDDEGAALIFDWDRHVQAWRQLDGADDGKRFRVSEFDSIQDNAQEIALAVSVSYGVNTDDVRAKVGEIPIITLNLEAGSPDCHWSEEKQQVLGSQFLDTAVGLGNRGVRRIHLFLAAQNSIVFRFGRLYDKRNLPEIVVYQFQKSVTPPYPWGILMPVCGIDQPAVVMNY